MTVSPPETVVRRFPALDSLRAVGAVAVLTTHAAFWAGVTTGHGVGSTLLARLDVGVAIFFALSGFLLARPWLSAAADGRPAPRGGRYLWHRFLRIAPLYLVTVVLALGLIRANTGLTWGDRVATALMLDTFVAPSPPAGLTHMWSLAVEVTFYVLLPVLMVAAVGPRRRPRLHAVRVLAVLAGLAALALVWHATVAPALVGRVAGQPGQWLPAYLSWFGVGIAVALAHQLLERGRAGRWAHALQALGRQPGACWALAAGLMLVSATPLAGPALLTPASPGQDLLKHVLYAAIGGVLLLSCVFAPAGWFRTLFEAPALRHLGAISYGIFCLHLPVLHLVMWTTGWELFGGRFAAIWVLTLAVSVVVAEVAHRLVERPSLRLRDFSPAHATTSAASTGTKAR